MDNSSRRRLGDGTMTWPFITWTMVTIACIAAASPAASQEKCQTVRDCTEAILAQVTALHEENAALARAVSDLEAQLPPTGSILAFEAATCPPGWAVYDRARGRFVLGLGGRGDKVVSAEDAGSRGGAPPSS
ncbi:hypothetical protein BQ8794_60101 [Mesorhizobium prunaredense]|uniref:Uncharacterized protein n=1 Tax=Mesorhizobium prunaredense TaxID=1631249 RepID=A0A1R3VFU6_9HYPH|nr:hypothetical protein BQ8794_60101 [Mesorhizobium prunaredense]